MPERPTDLSISKRPYRIDPDRARERARVASLSRTRAADDPELTEARASLQTARVDAYVARLVAEAPPLNDAQKTALAGLLRPVETRGGAAA